MKFTTPGRGSAGSRPADSTDPGALTVAVPADEHSRSLSTLPLRRSGAASLALKRVGESQWDGRPVVAGDCATGCPLSGHGWLARAVDWVIHLSAHGAVTALPLCSPYRGPAVNGAMLIAWGCWVLRWVPGRPEWPPGAYLRGGTPASEISNLWSRRFSRVSCMFFVF